MCALIAFLCILDEFVCLTSKYIQIRFSSLCYNSLQIKVNEHIMVLLETLS